MGKKNGVGQFTANAFTHKPLSTLPLVSKAKRKRTQSQAKTCSNHAPDNQYFLNGLCQLLILTVFIREQQ
jgi:hypothetical protein